LLFNDLLDLQPVALSEMPEFYLKGGNLRILYMLKTFTIKQVDTLRRVAIADVKKAKGPKEKLAAVGRAAKLVGSLVALGMTADAAKDLLFGRDFDLEDTVVDNLWKVLGISKYQSWQFRESPEKGVAKMVMPPFKIIESVAKDINTMTEGDFEATKSESIGSIPVGGKLFYWWFGAGAGKSQTRKTKKEWEGLSEIRALNREYKEIKDTEEKQKFWDEHKGELQNLKRAEKLREKYNELRNKIEDSDDKEATKRMKAQQDKLTENLNKLLNE
jgi:hypothetical protein